MAGEVGALVVAVGDGRDGDASLWAPLAGRPLLHWALAACVRAPDIQTTVLIVPAARLDDARRLCAAADYASVAPVTAPEPATPARDPIASGLGALAGALGEQVARDAWVVIQEAERPLVTTALIEAGLAARAPQAEGVVAALAVKETIKRARDGLVIETLDRARLRLTQTPQVYRLAALRAAYARRDPAVAPADPATLALRAGLRLTTFPGDQENLRVTTPDERALAEALLARRLS